MTSLNELACLARGKVEQIIKKTSNEVLRYIPKKTRKTWINEVCIAAQEEKDKVRTKVLQNPSEDKKRSLAQKQRHAKK